MSCYENHSTQIPLFITIEGIDGAGKTSAMTEVCKRLTEGGYDVLPTSALGGSEYGQEVRKLFLSQSSKHVSSKVESLIVGGAILEHRESFVLPAIKERKIVLCDRGVVSMLAYQAGCPFVRTVAQWCDDVIIPDLTIVLDVSPEVSLARTQSRANIQVDEEYNRYDDLKLHELAARRKVFLDWYALHKSRSNIIAAGASFESVVQHLIDMIVDKYDEKRLMVEH